MRKLIFALAVLMLAVTLPTPTQAYVCCLSDADCYSICNPHRNAPCDSDGTSCGRCSCPQ
jgi:hypothetical protein